MNSNLFSLDLRDFAKGMAIAVLAAVLQMVSEMVQAKGFSISAADWMAVLEFAAKVAFIYLSKNFLSDKEGKVLGKI